MIVAGPDGKIVSEVARNSGVKFSFHQSLAPQIKKLKKEGMLECERGVTKLNIINITKGYSIVALEQTKTSTCIYDFKFHRKTALVIGNHLPFSFPFPLLSLPPFPSSLFPPFPSSLSPSLSFFSPPFSSLSSPHLLILFSEGNERTGIPPNVLELVDNVIEIPGMT